MPRRPRRRCAGSGPSPTPSRSSATWSTPRRTTCYPAELAARGAAAGEKLGLSAEILDEDALAAGGYGGILAVGSGSVRKPRLLRLTYAGSGARKKIALVGKGITFDSGGISIKPAANMEDMKSDMAGAAAVIATVCLVAQLRLPVEVTATVPDRREPAQRHRLPARPTS